VQDATHNGCPTLAKAAMSDVEAKLAALDDSEKVRAKREVDRVRSNLDHTFDASWTAEAVKNVVNQTVMSVEGSTRFSEGSVQTLKAFDELVKLVNDQLSDEVNKKLLPAEAATGFLTRVEATQGKFRAQVIKAAQKKWGDLTKYNSQRNAGWDKETEANDIVKVIKQSEMGCEKSDAVARLIKNFLDDAFIAAAPERYKDAAELKTVLDEATAQYNAAVANVKKIREQVLSASEKLPPGRDRQSMAAYYRGSGRPNKERHGPDYGDDALAARIEAFVKSCEQEQAQSQADSQTKREKLGKASDDAWPTILGKWKLEKLEATEVLEKRDAWKGKAVKIKGTNIAGKTYEASYGLIIEIDGVPACGNYDDEVVEAMKKFQETTGEKPGAYEEYVAIVEGTCKVWERVADPNDSKKMIRGRQVDGVKLRIVALKAQMVAVAASGK
jgi:hypothetical protein